MMNNLSFRESDVIASISIECASSFGCFPDSGAKKY